MTPELDIDLTAFNRMCNDLARLTGRPFENVVKYEAVKVLEKASVYSKAAQVARIKAHFEKGLFRTYSEDMYTPRYPRRARSLHGGQLIYYLGNHYPDMLWGLIEKAQSISLAAALAARGLAKKSWDELARSFGFKIVLPAYASRARPSDGKTYPHDVSSHQQGDGARYSLHVVNAQPTINTSGAQGHRAFARAVHGRVKYFDQNVGHHVFTAAAAVAKKYPGVTVNPATFSLN